MKGLGAKRSRRPNQPAPQSRPSATLLLPQNAAPWEVHSVRVQYFELAHEVWIAGTFNDWSPEATPMRQDTKGNWTAELLLRPGEYEYRFLVDGQWKDDPMAKRYVGNSFGGFNCILEVKPFAANLSVKRAEPRAATATT